MGPNKEIMEVHGVNQVMHSSIFFYFLTHLNKEISGWAVHLFSGGIRGYIHSVHSCLYVYMSACVCASLYDICVSPRADVPAHRVGFV